MTPWVTPWVTPCHLPAGLRRVDGCGGSEAQGRERRSRGAHSERWPRHRAGLQPCACLRARAAPACLLFAVCFCRTCVRGCAEPGGG